MAISPRLSASLMAARALAVPMLARSLLRESPQPRAFSLMRFVVYRLARGPKSRCTASAVAAGHVVPASCGLGPPSAAWGSPGAGGSDGWGCAWNAVSAFANCGHAVAHVRGSYVPPEPDSLVIEDEVRRVSWFVCSDKCLLMHLFTELTCRLKNSTVTGGSIEHYTPRLASRVPSPSKRDRSLAPVGLAGTVAGSDKQIFGRRQCLS